MTAGPYSIGSNHWPGTSKVVEECGELLQVLGKLMGSGGDTSHWSGNLRPSLIEELADASSAIHFFAKVNLTPEEQQAFVVRSGTKGSRFWAWHWQHLEEGKSISEFETAARTALNSPTIPEKDEQ